MREVFSTIRRFVRQCAAGGNSSSATPENRQLIPDEKIRPLAQRLALQRPWRSAEENWLAAERAVRQPLRRLIIQFSGEKERSGWDWAELCLRVSVPVLVVLLSFQLNRLASEQQAQRASEEAKQQARRAREEAKLQAFRESEVSKRQARALQEQREDAAVRSFINDFQPLLLREDLRNSKSDDEVRGVGRALIIATLSQLRSEDAPGRRTRVLRFLHDSGLRPDSANPDVSERTNLFDLPDVNLSGADLSGMNFSGSNLNGANLSGCNLSRGSLSGALLNEANLAKAELLFTDLAVAHLVMANLREALLGKAFLRDADLRGASLVDANLVGTDLRGANLSEADLQGVKWNPATYWPHPHSFKGARNIPAKLNRELGL